MSRVAYTVSWRFHVHSLKFFWLARHNREELDRVSSAQYQLVLPPLTDYGKPTILKNFE
jgi:hypothetical protein